MPTPNKVFLLLPLVCLLFNKKVYGGQELIEQPSNKTVRIGGRVVLMCKVKNRAGTVQWTRNRFGLGTDRDLPAYDRYTMIGRRTDQGSDYTEEYSLQIESVELEDDGVYQCQVTPTATDLNGLRSREATVTVYVEPQPPMIEGSPVRPIVLGVPTNLTCRSNGGKPDASITWYKDNQRIANHVYTVFNRKQDKTSDAISSVTIVANKSDHEKKIECRAQNKATRIPLITDVILNVQYPPEITIGHNISGRSIREHDYVRFLCEGVANPQSIHWRWLRNGQTIKGETKKFLDLPNIDRIYHQDTISCQATNDVGSTTAEIKINMLYKPRFIGVKMYIPVDLNKTVTMNCAADGNPKPAIRWTRKDNHDSLSETETLTIPFIRPQHLGLYICEASSLSGGFNTEKIDIYLLLKAPPEIKSKVKQYAHPKEQARISCLVRSVPAPDSIVWSRNNEKIDSAQSGRYTVTEEKMADGVENFLHISDLRDSDFGPYTCSVFNSYGNDTVTITLAEEEGLPIAYIIGSICGGVAVLLFIAGACILYHKFKTSDNDSYAETDSNTEFKKREKSDSPSDFTKSTLMDQWRQDLNYHCPPEYDDVNNVYDPRLNSSGYGTLKSDHIINAYDNHNGHLFSDYIHRSDETLPVESPNGYNTPNIYGTSSFRSTSRTDFNTTDYSDPYRLPPANLSTTKLATNV